MVIRTSAVAACALPTDIVQDVMGFARKSALGGGLRGPAGEPIDPIRAREAREAAEEVERYASRMAFRGNGNVGRPCSAVVELDRPGDVAACPTLPDVSDVDVSIINREISCLTLYNGECEETRWSLA